MRIRKASLDLILIQKIRDLESGADLPSKEKGDKEYTRATVKFLTDLAKLLTAVWGRTTRPTEAWQVWLLISDIDARAKESESRRAEIAFWYSIDPYQLTESQIIGLYANLPMVKAQNRIENELYEPDDYLFIFYLHMLAYDDEKRALAARANAMRVHIENSTQGN